MEEKTVSAPAGFGTRPAEYRVAVVRITEGLQGTRGLTHVRVGFVPRPGTGMRLTSTDLRPGQEGCFFLTPHPDEPFHVLPTFFDVAAREGNPRFDAEVAQAREAARLLADPLAHLEARDAEERYLTAALLLVRYRTPPRVPPERRTTEAVGPRESGLILRALAEADWKRPHPGLGFQLAPQTLFVRLGVTEKDGFVRPKKVGEFPEAAREWLRGHADSYRIGRFVVKEAKEGGR